MVLQVAKDEDKEKELVHSEVPLPISGEFPTVEQTEEQPARITVIKQRGAKIGYVLSICLNLALIVAVIVLAVNLCRLKREFRELKEADEVELEPSTVVDNEDSVDVSASVDQANHDKIHSLEETYGVDEWFKNVRCKFIIRIYHIEYVESDDWW